MTYIREFAVQRAVAEGATHMRELPSKTLLFFRPSCFSTVKVKTISHISPIPFPYACMRVVWSGEERKEASYYSDWKWELVESLPPTAFPIQ